LRFHLAPSRYPDVVRGISVTIRSSQHGTQSEEVVAGEKEALAASDWRKLLFYARPPGERVSTSLDTNGKG
jgi:hypothetical protein